MTGKQRAILWMGLIWAVASAPLIISIWLDYNPIRSGYVPAPREQKINLYVIQGGR